jgi:hypothetical protein
MNKFKGVSYDTYKGMYTYMCVCVTYVCMELRTFCKVTSSLLLKIFSNILWNPRRLITVLTQSVGHAVA